MWEGCGAWCCCGMLVWVLNSSAIALVQRNHNRSTRAQVQKKPKPPDFNKTKHGVLCVVPLSPTLSRYTMGDYRKSAHFQSIVDCLLLFLFPFERRLGLRLEVAGGVALVQLLALVAPGAVHHAAPLHPGPVEHQLRPLVHVHELVGVQERLAAVQATEDQVAVPVVPCGRRKR